MERLSPAQENTFESMGLDVVKEKFSAPFRLRHRLYGNMGPRGSEKSSFCSARKATWGGGGGVGGLNRVYLEAESRVLVW